MFNRLNIKILSFIFIALLFFVVLTAILDSRKGERTFRSDLFLIDTAQITGFSIDPKGVDKPVISFEKSGSGWNIRSEGKTYPADNNVVNNLLSELSSLEAERIAATKKDSWKKFEVTDSLATIVHVEAGKKDESVYLGRFSYTQPKTQSPNPYGQQGKMSTFVRLGGENEVYSVNGFLGMSFNRNINDFRNKTVLRSNQVNWRKLSYTYPDSSFVLESMNDKWIIGGQPADSASVVEYLSGISSLTSNKFASKETVSGQPMYTLQIEGENMEPIYIEAFESGAASPVIIRSSLNPQELFADKSLADKLFTGKQSLLSP